MKSLHKKQTLSQKFRRGRGRHRLELPPEAIVKRSHEGWEGGKASERPTGEAGGLASVSRSRSVKRLFEMGHLKHREVKYLAQVCTASKWQGWDSNTGSTAPGLHS